MDNVLYNFRQVAAQRVTQKEETAQAERRAMIEGIWAQIPEQVRSHMPPSLTPQGPAPVPELVTDQPAAPAQAAASAAGPLFGGRASSSKPPEPPTAPVWDGDVRTCSICRQDFVERMSPEPEKVCRLSCRHMFHLDCWQQLTIKASVQPSIPQQDGIPECPNCLGRGDCIAV